MGAERLNNLIRKSSNYKELSDFSIYEQRNLRRAYRSTVSFHKAQLGENANEHEFIKVLIKSRTMENVEALSMVGNHVQLTLKTMETKAELLKKGLHYKGRRIIFRDPAVLVFSITIIECPPCYKIQDLVEFMGRFRTVHQGYEVCKTIENGTFKNGNRVFQFTLLNDLPPKRFKIDGLPVHLVYSDPDPSIFSEDLVERLSVWGESREDI